MEITLTKPLIDEIMSENRRAAENAQTEASLKSRALEAAQSALNTAQKAYNETNAASTSAIEARDLAQVRYQGTSKLTVGQKLTLTISGTNIMGSIADAATKQDAKADIRPAGWENNYGWSFPSSSGGKEGHEVTVGSYGLTACNCMAGRFGNTCWAQRGVQGAYKSSYGTFKLYETRPSYNGVTGTRVAPMGRAANFGALR
jgi:hypothetical protein